MTPAVLVQDLAGKGEIACDDILQSTAAANEGIEALAIQIRTGLLGLVVVELG